MENRKNDYLRQGNILVVDDTPANLTLLTTMLKGKGYKTRPVPSGRLALKAIESEAPDLILLDICMPEMDGYEVCSTLKKDARYCEIPVIFISALSETIDKVKAFGSGGLDYVTKPFQFEEVAARVETHLKLRRYQVYLEDLVKEKVREISDSQMATIFALSKLAESRDNDTGRHIERVQTFCKKLAEQLGSRPPYNCAIDAAFINNLHSSSPLHDIGKVGIPDNVLLKPAKLTPEEFEIMKKHAAIGADTLQAVVRVYPKNAFINMGVMVARSHHERWDGKGYPDGLKGEEIPLAARIMAVADVYDALRSKRCYKSAMTREQSRDIIVQGRSTQFDPETINAFTALEEEFERIGHAMDYT